MKTFLFLLLVSLGGVMAAQRQTHAGACPEVGEFPDAGAFSEIVEIPQPAKLAPTVVYERSDSLRVMELLRSGRGVTKADRFMHYANALKGVKYVAHTLDLADADGERLIVNMRGLDCTTYIDVVMALSLATDEGSFEAFCRHLQRVRYRDGVLDGYASRNHYFAESVLSSQRQGLMRVIDEGDAVQTLDIHYMTSHRDLYGGIKCDDGQFAIVREHERAMTGSRVRYFSREALRKSDAGTDGGALRRAIKTGDILGIVTRRSGLDTTHLGIAVWGRDGKLHLLNASRLRGKVVLEPKTLYQYMLTQRSQLGVRVVRPVAE